VLGDRTVRRVISGGTAGRVAVGLLGFAAFAVGTCELVLAGVLPGLSSSFGVPVSVGGQVVTVFGLTCALLAPGLATATARWPRRPVLLGALGLYLLGVAGTAVAPVLPVVFAAQVVAAAGAGLFLPAATAAAAGLVPERARGRAIAVVSTGMTAATALGAPLGTVIGGLAGWRATMWFVAGLAVLAGAGLVAVLPRGQAGEVQSLRERVRPLADRRVLALLGTTLCAFTAVYLPYTYISAVFAPATGGDPVRLAVLMSAVGVVGAGSNLAAGALVDRLGGRAVVAGALSGLAVVLAALPLGTGNMPAALVLVVLYGAVGFAVTTPQSHRLVALRPESGPVLLSLNAAVLYLAISLSGAVGAGVIELAGAAALGVPGVVLVLAALGASELAARAPGLRTGAGLRRPRRR